MPVKAVVCWCSVFEVENYLMLCFLLIRNEFKRDGSGRGNWGGPTDEVVQ